MGAAGSSISSSIVGGAVSDGSDRLMVVTGTGVLWIATCACSAADAFSSGEPLASTKVAGDEALLLGEPPATNALAAASSQPKARRTLPGGTSSWEVSSTAC